MRNIFLLFSACFLSSQIFLNSGSSLAVAEELKEGTSSTTAEAQARSRRGLITSGPCPLTCEDLKVPAGECRAWRQGNKCMVEDYTQVPGHRSMFKLRAGDYSDSRSAAPRTAPGSQKNAAMVEGRRGLVTSSSCPYTCKMAKIPESQCREWQQGTTCMVEDFGQPAGHRSLIRLPR